MQPYWDINQIKNLPYKPHENPTSGFNFCDPNDEHRYLSIIAHLYQGLPKTLDTHVLDIEFSWLRDKSYSVSKMLPGDILPLHYDKYAYYSKTYNVPIEKICRVIVFLEDWKIGHYLHINDTPVEKWKAGDWVKWYGSTIHTAGNVGNQDRYILQITGHEA